MSGTAVRSRRYMELYVYWPVALAPEPRSALLISYGVGTTARALVEAQSLERIDIVEISREILELSDTVFADTPNPLRDPRVHVTVEDGRYFLQSSRRRWDLITSEPPPPKNAGIANLYTREYFELVYDRLSEGGVNTYWLPVHSLTERDALTIIRAYCEVFADCTLWTGTGFDWMLAGSRGAAWMRSEEHTARQWRDPALAPKLRALGLERPEQLGAMFMADARELLARSADVEPLTDDFPRRLDQRLHDPELDDAGLRAWMDTDRTRAAFASSEFVRAAFPPGLRERTLAYFEWQEILNELAGPTSAPLGLNWYMDALHRSLTETELVTLPLWLLGPSHDEIAVAERVLAGRGPELGRARRLAPWLLGRRDLAERDFSTAAARLEIALAQAPRDAQRRAALAYARCRAGQPEAGLGTARAAPRSLREARAWREFEQWLAGVCGS
jgi:spermidine synthase